jgi:hypothetical protein
MTVLAKASSHLTDRPASCSPLIEEETSLPKHALVKKRTNILLIDLDESLSQE